MTQLLAGPAPVRSRRERMSAPAWTLGSLAVATLALHLRDPHQQGSWGFCPLAMMGIYCPGCGGLRSAHAFAHGDLAAAFGANALAVVGYGIFAVLWAVWLVREVCGRPLRIALRPVHWWAIGAVLLIFTVVRNLPFGSALAP